MERELDGKQRGFTLADESALELLEELEVEQILRGQSLLSDDSLHGLHILSDGVASILKQYIGRNSQSNVKDQTDRAHIPPPGNSQPINKQTATVNDVPAGWKRHRGHGESCPLRWQTSLNGTTMEAR
jgi:hypothetical protein